MDIILPTVKGEFGETPEIEFPEGVKPPAGLRIKVLHEGDGPVVSAGDEIECEYHGQIWGGEIFDSSYYRDGKAVFPSLLMGKYLLGVTAKNYEVFSQSVEVTADQTLPITLLEKIVKPYNLTTDVKIGRAHV